MSLDSDNRRDRPSAGIPPFRVVAYGSLALVGFAADILTKSFVFGKYFRPGQPPIQHWWIEGILGIETTTNPGALFGMFPGQRWLFATLSIIALVSVVTWLFAFGGARDRWLTVSLGLISGGILGNLFDRLGLGYRPGYLLQDRYNVRDWIYFRWEGIPFLDPWPNFNIADSLLVCGAALLILHSFFGSHAKKDAAPADDERP